MIERRRFSYWIAFGMLACASVADAEARGLYVLNAQETYILEDGDGDPAFIHVRHEVRLTDASWFSGRMMGSLAFLFEVVGEPHAGQYVAVISRVLQPVPEQIATYGLASVIARPVLNPTSTFDELSDLGVGGMTVLRRKGDERFEP